MTNRVPGVAPRYGPDGLVPVVVQDESDGRVLMLAWSDAEALAATFATGELHFHSRSRGRLWRKGESSGNVLHVVRLDLDCDADALLATVRPHGPTCHRGTRSCFDADDGATAPADRTQTALTAADDDIATTGADLPGPQVSGPDGQGFAWLETLWSTIEHRRRSRPPGSYTTSLLAGGVDVAGRKVTEEATEVLMAAKNDAAVEASGGDRSRTGAALADEMADLVFHALVLLAERGQAPGSAIDVLKARHGPPG